jgi:hypothetical protein
MADEIEHDPMYRSYDTRVLAGNEDAHLDAPRSLDSLSEKQIPNQLNVEPFPQVIS